MTARMKKMKNYNQEIISTNISNESEIHSFIDVSKSENIDWNTVESFGEEWEKFAHFSKDEITSYGDEYFDIVNDEMLNKDSYVLDMGCGTGRWTRYVALKAGFVEAIDPSKAVISASKLLKGIENIRISHAEVSNIPFEDKSFDFVFSLGVLHHIPNTQKAMEQTVSKLKVGGYFLVYLYYALDNKGLLFKTLFHFSNFMRWGICKLPSGLKKLTCDFLAVIFYLPFIFVSKIVFLLFGEKQLQNIPLSYYHNKTWNVIRNDSLDRFGTPLEQRFSKEEIRTMMNACGLTDIKFSNKPPFWHAVGRKQG